MIWDTVSQVSLADAIPRDAYARAPRCVRGRKECFRKKRRTKTPIYLYLYLSLSQLDLALGVHGSAGHTTFEKRHVREEPFASQVNFSPKESEDIYFLCPFVCVVPLSPRSTTKVVSIVGALELPVDPET